MKLLIQFSIPILIGNLFQQIYTLADRIIVGRTCILLAIAMTVLSLVTTKPILLLLNTPQSILPDALTYMYIFMGGLLAIAAYYTPFSILRALGDSKTPLIFLVVCSLLNIVLDLLFVVVFKTGVAGAAIATVLSEAIAAVLCIIQV